MGDAHTPIHPARQGSFLLGVITVWQSASLCTKRFITGQTQGPSAARPLIAIANA